MLGIRKKSLRTRHLHAPSWCYCGLQLARRPSVTGGKGIGSASLSAWTRMAPVVGVLSNACAMLSTGSRSLARHRPQVNSEKWSVNNVISFIELSDVLQQQGKVWHTWGYYFEHALVAHLGTIVIGIRYHRSESEFSMGLRRTIAIRLGSRICRHRSLRMCASVVGGTSIPRANWPF